MEHRSTLKAAKELAGSHLIASCAALAALFLFIPTGRRIVAAALDGSLSTGIDRTSAIAFLLNIAVILFAWRRSKDLQRALADNEAVQQTAHDNAFIDHVTGLANRRELMRLLAEAAASKKSSKLLLLDLDFFKKVNDLYGHVVGDQVLKRVSDIIQRLAPHGACCARLGGDEFALLIPNESQFGHVAGHLEDHYCDCRTDGPGNGDGACFRFRRCLAHRRGSDR